MTEETWFEGVQRRAQDLGDGWARLPISDWEEISSMWPHFEAKYAKMKRFLEQHGGHPELCSVWVELDDVVAALHPVGTCNCGLAELVDEKIERMVM